MDQIKIAAFGCWNRKVNENGKIPMEYVIENIESKEQEFNHLVVLGDNYYGKKQKIEINGVQVKTVEHIQDDLEYGFNLIEKLKIPKKYLIMGNHDIEDTLDKECVGLQTQVNKVSKFNIMFPFYSKIITLSNGTKIKYIFIDTTVYSIKANPSCYDKVLNKNSKKIIQEQNKFIVDELSDSSIKYFIFFAHEPLYSLKTKIFVEDNLPHLVDDVLDDLAGIILSNSQGKNVFYVCADVHMYQSGTVTDKFNNSVKQIVCGTGGGEKDSFVLDDKIFNKNNFTYSVDITKDSYGYVEIVINSREVKHSYINVYPDGQVKRYNKKYLVQY